MISPNTTMPKVDPITAQIPFAPGMLSRSIGMTTLTRTFPKSSEQRRKLPKLRTGKMALAFSCSASEPVLITICSSVWSKDMSPRLRPEKRPERQRRKARKMKLT